jgi:SAM-dependent methyltransferase
MDRVDQPMLNKVAEYYTEKIATHGQTAAGVDWNGDVSQTLRFQQLCSVIGQDSGIVSVNDLGCGYGAMFDYLLAHHPQLEYEGVDISESMIEAASLRYNHTQQASFVLGKAPTRVRDFSIASGIFNVRFDFSDAAWLAYIEATLEILDRSSQRGFAFNCLTSYSDAEKMQSRLYYADPLYLFDLCKRKYSKNVALLHDYGLYEFTIRVNK